jgi:hypothetical protein
VKTCLVACLVACLSPACRQTGQTGQTGGNPKTLIYIIDFHFRENENLKFSVFGMDSFLSLFFFLSFLLNQYMIWLRMI